MPDELQVVQQVDFYGRIPENLLFNPDVSSDACVLYAALTRYDWRQSHEVWPTWGLLEKRLGWSRRKIARIMAELRDREAIEVHRHGRQATLIILLADVLEVSNLAPQESLGCQIETLEVPDRAPQPSIYKERKKESVRATRLPIPFDVTDPMVDWVESEFPGLDWERETSKFVDHWKAASGRNATKMDWPAAWRNWMRKSTEGWK